MTNKPVFPTISLAGEDYKMRRLIRYWGATVLLYLLCIAVLWVEVLAGAADATLAAALTGLTVLGHALFYLLTRFSNQLGFTPAQLAETQARFAIVCTVLGYVVIGPFRGATLLVLLVILVFCAFTLKAQQTRSLSTLAVVLLGLTMLAMVLIDPVSFNPRTELQHFILVGTMVTVVGFLTGRLSEMRAALAAQKAELSSALARIQELATRDALTMLPNRRHISDVLAAGDGTLPACLALLDIDWFKHVNDTYGHATGDEVLREFARESSAVLRAGDMLARWGGEEFLLYLPGTRLDAARAVMERLQAHIGSLRFALPTGGFGVTFSGGLVEFAAGEAVAEAIGRADRLLYAAKAGGRNRVLSEGDAAHAAPA